MEIKLGMDMDGVLYDWHTAIYTHYQYLMNYAGTYQEFWLDFFPNLSVNKQDYAVSIPIPYDMIVAPKHVTDFLNFASERAEIYYITARVKDLEPVTRRYISRYNFPFQDNLIFTHDKASTCSEVGITHFIDDFSSHAQDCAKMCESYLMNKLWNKDDEGDFTRVYNLAEFREKVFGS